MLLFVSFLSGCFSAGERRWRKEREGNAVEGIGPFCNETFFFLSLSLALSHLSVGLHESEVVR